LLTHGGQLHAAAQKYAIPVNQWLDLSTGINPNGYPVPAIPAACWLRLPEHEDGLIQAAQDYYQAESLFACAGSQAAIQALPLLRKKSQVGVLHPAYAEHGYCWKKAGHQLIELTSEMIETHLSLLDVLIIINPNNPTGCCFSKAQLLNWHQQLDKKGGWLIVDEAFIDATPSASLISEPPRRGLILLRSLGKFFGLAGLRCGFVSAEQKLLTALEEKFGVWSISHPSRYLATVALQDTLWQQQTRANLPSQSVRLKQVLQYYQLTPSGSNALFHWVKTPYAETIYQQLGQQGILIRLFDQPSSLRFGLPKTEQDWQRLEQAFARIYQMKSLNQKN